MDSEKRRKLIALLGMIGSAHDGEVLNAAKMAQRLLGSEGMSWEEFCNARGNSGGSRSYIDGYNEGYRVGLAKGAASAVKPARPLSWTAFCKRLSVDCFEDLSEWEQGFVESFIERGWNEPTPKQHAIFVRIAQKCGVELPD